MSRDSRFDILFEPVKIGPVTARNRFYQVPHCSGMGYRYPNAEAHLRGMKAEGGWAVVSTQEAEIHPTSDLTPANEARLWDDGDLPAFPPLRNVSTPMAASRPSSLCTTACTSPTVSAG